MQGNAAKVQIKGLFSAVCPKPAAEISQAMAGENGVKPSLAHISGVQ
jgi:hypothetical protein